MTSEGKKEFSEAWFEQYLGDHGIAGGDDHHPELGHRRRPDYRISRGADVAICEVKEFTDSGVQRRFAQAAATGRPHPFVTSNEEEFGTVRNTISNAAKKQLRPFRDRGEALAVVLANPRGIAVRLEDPIDIVAAMYGNQAFSVAVGLPEGQSDPGRLVFTDDGVLTDKHRYLSAVITLHYRTNAQDAKAKWAENRPRVDDTNDLEQRAEEVVQALEEPGYKAAAQTSGDYVYARVYSTISTVTGEALPVPRSLFSGPRDQYWVANEYQDRFELQLAHGTLEEPR